MNYPIKASLPVALLFAVAGVAVLYIAQLFLFPEVDSGMAYRVLWGNAISPVILGVFLIAILLLLSKRKKLQREKKSSQYFLSQIAPRLIDDTTRIESVTDHHSDVHNNLLVNRWRRMQVSNSRVDNSDADQKPSELEMEHLQNSYAVPRFFVWALPIIGFVGTVWGIGQSIAFFSDTMSSSQAGASVSALLQQNIPLVTKGLSTAFDTTFLALLLSLPATAFLVLTERDERDYLLSLDEQMRHFLARRHDPVEELEAVGVEPPEHLSHAQAVGETLRDLREDAFDHYQQQLTRKD